MWSRANLSHDRIAPECRLSFLEFPPGDLDFAESFYIGVCRPKLNFKGKETR